MFMMLMQIVGKMSGSLEVSYLCRMLPFVHEDGGHCKFYQLNFYTD